MYVCKGDFNMVKFIKENKNAIIIGLFFFFIQIIYNLLSNKIPIISSNILVNYNDNLYQRVAQRDYNLEMFIFYYIFTFFIVCFSLIIVYVLFKVRESKNEFKIFEDKINELYQKSSEINKSEEYKQNNVEEYIEKINSQKKIFIKSSNFTLFIIVISFICQLLFGFYNFSTELTIRKKVLDYENTKRIILPYISEHEDKTFEYKFVLIKNQKDYINLLNEMNDVIRKYGLMIIWEKK
jgi:predicted PurR-regulated permease PerM